jgi:hypothetical protein
MFIYRIEDKDNGLGCYRFLDEINWLQSHNKFNGRPYPAEDKGIERGMEEEEICGFKDLRQLKNWFKLNEVKKLREEGFTIRKIEVEKITAYGEKQVLAILKEKRLL